jgi:hypothetical protein
MLPLASAYEADSQVSILSRYSNTADEIRTYYNLGPRWYHDKVPSRKPLEMISRVVDMDRQRDPVHAAYTPWLLP